MKITKTKTKENITTTPSSTTTATTYKVKCSCCGKVFVTEEPKQDLCIKCMNELADYLALDCD